MHRLLYTTLIAIIAGTNGTFAQVADSGRHYLLITVNPTQIVDPFEGICLGMGAEYGINHRLAVFVSGGSYLYNQPSWMLRSGTKGYMVKTMIKHYLNTPAYAGRHALCVEYMYKRQTYRYEDSFQINTAPAYSKKYTISSYVSCVNITYEWTMVYWHRLVVEPFAGAGIRFKNATSDLAPVEKNSILTGENHGSDIGAYERDTGHHIYPNITFGIKIGYKIF